MNDLSFEVIESGEYLDKNHLLSREQSWFYHFKDKTTNIPYFNTLEIAGNSEGYKHTEITKKHQSEVMKGKKRKPFSKEHKKHISESKKGIPRSEEYKQMARINWSTEKRIKSLETKKCPYCGLEGRGPNMSRYHFKNCKYKV